MKEKLVIFDTTLRDGEQSPGASMTQEEKIRIARQLEKMKVDVIEAGFPAASPGDFASVNAIAGLIKNSVVCGLARANPDDVRKAGEALKKSDASRIHTFIATSPIHMKSKLRMSGDQVVEHAVAAVTQARQYTDNVEFSPEDAGRSEFDFLCHIIEKVINAGATTINIPDTVGYNLPGQFGGLIQRLIEAIPNSDKVVFSVHCHNDLGLAVANSLSAVMAGARQVECTVNGLGERAGNASLEEIVMAVRTRQDEFNCDTGIDTTQIVPASRLVSNITGFPVQPNKAIVGANAFAHEAGIHQDGVIKARETYEIMSAEDVGWGSNRMVLGKHSGRHAFVDRLKDLGFEFSSDDEMNDAFRRFKKMADSKHEIFDDDLQALVTETGNRAENDHFTLKHLKTSSETGIAPSSRVVIEIDDKEVASEQSGNGAVDATFKAIEEVLNTDSTLQLFSVNSVTGGSDAQGEVSVRLEKNGEIYNGHGTDLDIVVASARAYINAANKIYGQETRIHPQRVSGI
ncbi:MAG: 2-isopropylmalate synthase [Gammaproteobacteria bacterium]|nr:2-isopropylmalate synthase [Gammaproteobacteria bacterium]